MSLIDANDVLKAMKVLKVLESANDSSKDLISTLMATVEVLAKENQKIKKDSHQYQLVRSSLLHKNRKIRAHNMKMTEGIRRFLENTRGTIMSRDDRNKHIDLERSMVWNPKSK